MTDRTKDYEHDRRRHLWQLRDDCKRFGLNLVWFSYGDEKTATEIEIIREWDERNESAFQAMVDEDCAWATAKFANSIVEEWIRDACPECHGSGWADEGRPCEHPRGGVR